MRKMKYLKLQPAEVKRQGTVITARFDDAEQVLILDIFMDRQHSARYLLQVGSGEHKTYEYLTGTWHDYSIAGAMGQETLWVNGMNLASEASFASEEEAELAFRALGEPVDPWISRPTKRAVFEEIMRLEREYVSDKRCTERVREVQRYKTMVDSVPELPADFDEWARGLIAPEDYALGSWTKGKAHCTACGSEIDRKALKAADGSGRQAAQGEEAVCPVCGHAVTVRIRSKFIEKTSMVSILQDIDSKKSVARFVDIGFSWSLEGKKTYRSESMWIFLLRHDKRFSHRILYNTILKSEWEQNGCFWKSNPANRTTKAGYMYPGGIEVALAGTDYHVTARLIRAMADGKICLNYNRVLAAYASRGTLNMLEYLYKGRFFRLLKESVENIDYWDGGYRYGPLTRNGRDIEEVFGISDRQKINRIRDLDGGESLVEWMQLSDETGEKIPQETLTWLAENNIRRRDLKDFSERMSVTKIANYVRKQQAGGYKDRTARAVLSQWSDYLSMCRQEKKNLADDMVFRPRELKRRHDEIVQEINHRKMLEELKRSKAKAAEEAKRMREKFPGAEEALREIRERFEYSSDEYMIIVPQKLIEITTEGIALHHCVGSSDRYFERIRNHETYVCFLRKVSEPKVPYYTIEVEPGGTVRQHRGYLDEEPEIEKVKPFIREWQSVLKKRLTEEDRKRAKKSKILREKNIEELKAKKNKRVLDGLMEDLMEAEAV